MLSTLVPSAGHRLVATMELSAGRCGAPAVCAYGVGALVDCVLSYLAGEQL